MQSEYKNKCLVRRKAKVRLKKTGFMRLSEFRNYLINYIIMKGLLNEVRI